MRIVFIDPGGTTALAMFLLNDEYGFRLQETVSGTMHEMAEWTWYMAEEVDLVVVESYITGARMLNKIERETMEFIGYLKFMLDIKGVKVVMQAPNVKAFWTVQRMREDLGDDVYNHMVRGKSEHIKDAIKHGLYWHRKQKGAK